MRVSFIRIFFLFLTASHYVSSTPLYGRAEPGGQQPAQQQGSSEEDLEDYHEEPKEQNEPIDMPGIDWRNFGFRSKNPRMDNFLVTSRGQQAQIAVDSSRSGIYVMDHMGRDKDAAPSADFMSDLLHQFRQNKGRPPLRFLAITNIHNKDTVAALKQYSHSGMYIAGDQHFNYFYATPLGQVAHHVSRWAGAVRGMRTGAVGNAQYQDSGDGPTMVFIFDKKINLEIMEQGGGTAETSYAGSSAAYKTANPHHKLPEDASARRTRLQQTGESSGTQGQEQSSGGGGRSGGSKNKKKKKKGKKKGCIVMRRGEDPDDCEDEEESK